MPNISHIKISRRQLSRTGLSFMYIFQLWKSSDLGSDNLGSNPSSRNFPAFNHRNKVNVYCAGLMWGSFEIIWTLSVSHGTPHSVASSPTDLFLSHMASTTSRFLFHKESAFIEFDNGSQLIFDMINNVHLLTSDSYELFSEAQ